jgi:NAD(P)-dependent dehydrogenase (short-subunit alcohol dehydrogenase family)
MAALDLLDEGNKRKNYCNGEVKSQVIVTGSVGGFSRIVGGRNAYRASKAAVTHLSKCLATGFQEFGIRVNTLAPGLFESELAASLVEKYNGFADEDGKIDRKRVPEERIGVEEDITGTMLYLASRAGAYNNGHVCVVDGGLVSVMPATY